MGKELLLTRERARKALDVLKMEPGEEAERELNKFLDLFPALLKQEAKFTIDATE